jgi:glycosyltransferase involved in cell wall biosynthesis
VKAGFLSRQFGHHGQHTGYNLLAARWKGVKALYFLPGGTERARPPVPWLNGLAQGLAKRRIRSAALRDRVDVLHVLYGEVELPFPELSARQKLVATIHQPISHLSRSQQRIDQLKRQLQNVALTIALSSEQKSFLQELLPGRRVEFVRHGVDTDFFVNLGCVRERTVLVSCGWYRDLEFARSVLRELAAKDPGLRLKAFGGGAPQLASASPRIEVMTGLSDEELRREYCSCALVFLPLKETVANNALLEAMSCGTAIVAPTLPAVRDYLVETDTCYPRGSSPTDIAEFIHQLVERRSPGLPSVLRTRALESTWGEIAQQMEALYRTLCE